jgi:hypothetical protein
MSDMTELFNRDPLKLTNEDIDQIIEEMRKRRHLYKSAPATSTGAKPTLTAKQKAVTSKLNLDFDI